MTNAKYKFTFCARGFLRNESIKVAQEYLKCNDWSAIRNIIVDQNILQTRTKRTSVNLFSEISRRLKCLTAEQLNLLVAGHHKNEVQILWLAICKCYQYINDFAIEVIREKYLQLELNIERDDYDGFFNKKAEWHDEVDNLKPSTIEELRGSIFRYLREAEILTTEHHIIPTTFTAELADAIINDPKANFAIFPISDADIRELKH